MLEVECGIWVHWGCLYEWLELIAWMCGSSFDAKYPFNWFFSQQGITQSVSDMWEFLVFSPLDIVFAALIMIIMMCLRSVLQGLLEVDFLSLWEPCSCRFSPPVVEFKEQVVQVHVLVTCCLQLVEVWSNVTYFVQVVWSDLADMQIDQVVVVSVDLKQFVTL